jgi:hypothetical protein
MFVALRALRQSRVLSRTLAAQYAQLAGSLGHEDEYREALSALRGGK